MPGERSGSGWLGRRCCEAVADLTCRYFCSTDCNVAVVKVPPSVGCVKYKAQDVVLLLRILLFWAGWVREWEKIAGNRCGSPRKSAMGAGLLHQLRGMFRCPDTVGCPNVLSEGRPVGRVGQGAGVVQGLWMRVGKWKRRVRLRGGACSRRRSRSGSGGGWRGRRRRGLLGGRGWELRGSGLRRRRR
jgi:hypothetical protein